MRIKRYKEDAAVARAEFMALVQAFLDAPCPLTHNALVQAEHRIMLGDDRPYRAAYETMQGDMARMAELVQKAALDGDGLVDIHIDIKKP